MCVCVCVVVVGGGSASRTSPRPGGGSGSASRTWAANGQQTVSKQSSHGQHPARPAPGRRLGSGLLSRGQHEWQPPSQHTQPATHSQHTDQHMDQHTQPAHGPAHPTSTRPNTPACACSSLSAPQSTNLACVGTPHSPPESAPPALPVPARVHGNQREREKKMFPSIQFVNVLQNCPLLARFKLELTCTLHPW